ncbi:gliding motility-associated C-terminal domain-containing protein [Myroides sp. mNGS23_01]|nr:gliding motility-associated C-terminal domain-containing protein [Myroides sp. mNGS23_01]WHT39887.1 gliding motility-associated C-terminal domain-containing protein [Myroides sp. mNGS23_01]
MGVKVYETTNYDSAGNVFRGYSEGRVTINKDKALPTGTYFYIITYEVKNQNGSNIVKKSGYLHLETE